MEGNLTPRQMAKGLLTGIVPSRPLFLPIAFSIGAKVENLPLGAFLDNPTKISSSLRQMRTHLRTDGVSCYFDPFLELEALGAVLEPVSDDQPPIVHWPLPARVGELPTGLRSPEEAAKNGRVPAAVEVIRRMNAFPNREFLLMAGVTGPMTLAARITRLEHTQNLRSEELCDSAQELAGSVVTQMATSFLDAGADVIFLQEEIVPDLSLESCDTWANLLAPAINVIRFYEALPVLQLATGSPVLENWDLIFQRQWDCVVCAPVEVMVSQRRNGTLNTTGVIHGISLPVELFQSDSLSGGELCQIIPPMISELRPAIVTTAGDLPVTTDMKSLISVIGEISRAL